MFIYITYDTDGFITAYQNTEADGYTKVFILDSWITQFSQHSDKFRYDTDKKVVLNPGNLPNVSLDEVNTSLQNLQTSVSASQNELQNTIQSGSQGTQALTALAQNQSALAVQVQQALASVTALAQDNSQTSETSNSQTSPKTSSTSATN